MGKTSLCGLVASAVIVSMLASSPALAQTRSFDVPAQDASTGIIEFGKQADIQIAVAHSDAAGARTNAVKGDMTVDKALTRLLAGSGLAAQITSARTYMVSAQPVAAKLAIVPLAPKVDVAVPNALKDDVVVVVTGSRVAVRGFVQPTPTTVLDGNELAKSAEPNMFMTVTQLPSLQGSSGTQVNVFSTSSGLQGLSALSLRGLGANRTLTLIDGQRVVPANVTGIVDISELPQLLVKRVDVVTGGASASYGSDAIGGVVNFITDTNFQGFKANIEGGETTYHDDRNLTYQSAWGHNFLSGRLHVQISEELSTEGGVPASGLGDGAGPDGRNWFKSPAFEVRPISETTDGKPQYIAITNAQQFQYAKFGLITSGPLQGTAFGANGTPYQFNYGSNGTPTGTGEVTGCVTPFCSGGDLSGDAGNGTSYASALKRTNAYSRIGYDLDDRNEIFSTVNISQVDSSNTPNPGAPKNANLTIQCSNPFVPAEVQAECAADNITSFQFGTANAEFPQNINVHTIRRMYRYVVGAAGKFDALDTEWTYSTYGEYGVNYTHIFVDNVPLNPRYNNAIDAIVGVDGTVVCRNPVAQASGCVPLDVIGNVSPSEAALAYVLPANGPFQKTRETQDVLSFNVTGEPFSTWAGFVGVATGVEYRKEYYKAVADPYGNGVSADSPNSPAYPVDPLVNTSSGNNWYAGNYHDGQGGYDVKEGYLEANAPVLSSNRWGAVNLNIAGRLTDYSTAGWVNTWKIGGTWKTGIDGLRFRAVTSRDMRAPNLSELFSPQVVTNNTVNYLGSTVTIQALAGGNTNLKPEIARNTDLGVVLSQLHGLPGFSASFDYYKIDIKGVISSLSSQQVVDLCVAGHQEECEATLLNSPIPNTDYVRSESFNLAALKLEGFDIEASYRTKLAQFGIPGEFYARLLATRTIHYITDPGIPGTIPTEGAGVNLSATPYWKGLATQNWEHDRIDLTLTERWISDGVYSHEWIVCQTHCPVATAVHPTIANDSMKGAFYWDVGGTYRINSNTTAYFKVTNLTNLAPVPAPQTNVGYDFNPALYDVIGRMYRVGVRLNF